MAEEPERRHSHSLSSALLPHQRSASGSFTAVSGVRERSTSSLALQAQAARLPSVAQMLPEERRGGPVGRLTAALLVKDHIAKVRAIACITAATISRVNYDAAHCCASACKTQHMRARTHTHTASLVCSRPRPCGWL